MEEQIPPLSDRELLVRIDTKLDGVIEDKKDQEARIRSIESRIPHFVTGKQLWVGLASAVTAASAGFQVINWIANHH